MKKRRIVIILSVVIVVAIGVAYHFLFGYMVVNELNESVTVLRRENIFNQIGANVIVYSNFKEAIVVDSQLAPLASSTRSHVEALSDAKIKKVIVTHWHPDHSGGISSYTDNTEVIAHANVLQRLSTQQEGFGLTKPGSHHKFEPRSKKGLPNKIVEDRLRILIGSTNVEVVYFPNAHTDGDLVVFFHDSEIAAIGDLVWSNSFPFIDVHNGGSVVGLEQALQKIIDQSKQGYRFIPGHGATITFDELVKYLAIVNESRRWVELRLDEGSSVDEIIKIGLPDKWNQWQSKLIPSSEWIKMIEKSRNSHNFRSELTE